MIENLSNKLFFYHSKLNISRTVVDKTQNIPHIVSLAFKTMDRVCTFDFCVLSINFILSSMHYLD